MSDITPQQLADLGLDPNSLQQGYMGSSNTPAAPAPTSQDLAATSPQAPDPSPTPDASFLTSPIPAPAPTASDLATASGSAPAPSAPSDSQTGGGVKDFPDYHTFSEQMFGVKRGDWLRPEDKKLMMDAWTKAYTAHKEVAQPRIYDAGDGNKFLLSGNNTPLRIDPKAPTSEQIQLADGTMGRYITDTKSPDYLKFQPVYDPSTGQPMKAKMGNAPDAGAMMNGIQLNDLKAKLAVVMANAARDGADKGGGWFGGAYYTHQAAALQAQIQSLQSQASNAPASAELPTPAPAPAASPSPTPVAASSAAPAPNPVEFLKSSSEAKAIKQLYSSGAIDRGTAQARLNALIGH